MRRLTLAFVLAIAPPLLRAQTPAQLAAAAEAVSARDIAGHISVLANDSMLGRNASARGRELTAQYVADQFAQLGLKAGGDSGTWFQRYPIATGIDISQSQLSFAAGDKRAAASLMTAAYLALPVVPEHSAPSDVILIAGPHTTKSVEQADVRNKTVLYVPSSAKPTDAREQEVRQLLLSKAYGLIILSNLDSAAFTARLRQTQQQPIVRLGPAWDMHVRPEAVEGLQEVLAAGGVDLAQARAETMPVARDLPALRATLDLKLDRSGSESATGTNVIGIIEGSDPDHKEQYVVLSAHMDHASGRHGPADSLFSGADDNASGTAGLIELAKAFRQAGVRPARSIMFLATGSGPQGARGADVFADGGRLLNAVLYNTFNFFGQEDRPISHVTINLNLDMIGTASADSLVINGLADVDLATPPAWLAAAHPELGLTIVDGGTVAQTGSDHFAFAGRGVPSLYFHTKTDSVAQRAGAPLTIDAEQEARVLRLAFYIAHEIATAKQRPKWTPEGRQRYLQSRRID